MKQPMYISFAKQLACSCRSIVGLNMGFFFFGGGGKQQRFVVVTNDYDVFTCCD